MTLNNIYQRKAPFLHRNWLQGITNWQTPAELMGNIVSSQLRRDGHVAAPPRKRRRVSTPESLDVDHLIISPKTSDTRCALRIEIRKVCHKDSQKFRTTSLGGTAPSIVTTTKANCRITVSNTAKGTHRVLHCQNQACELTTFKNPVGPHRIARVNLARPFYVPRDAILVNRDDDGSHDLSDAYELLIEFEAVSESIWPPLGASDFGSSAMLQDASPIDMRNLVLRSRFQDIFGKLKGPLVLSALDRADRPESLTEYIMDVDLRWSSGFNALRRLDKDSMPYIMAIDPDNDLGEGRLPPTDYEDSVPVNSLNGHSGFRGPVRSDDEQTEGEKTPSRALRRREQNKIYNLKVLSDQARGKERKKRLNTGTTAVASPVSYLLPLDQPVLLDCNRCVACGSYHESLMQLQMHLQTYHPSYNFQCETTSQGPQFRVHHRRSDTSLSPSKKLQIQPTVQSFNLQTFVAGDESWVTKRVIAEKNDDLPKTPSAHSSINRMSSHSPLPRQPVFPASKATLPRRPQQPKKDTVVVPKISQPLYHPISKAELKAGDPVPSPEYDATWLIQKHRESIADFTDVTPQEKEFIWEWDGYILEQGITSSAYLPRAWLGFVQQKAAWLVAKDERMREFGKHASVLVAREVLTDNALKQALDHINQARSLRTMDVSNAILPADAEQVATTSKATDVRKSSNGCTVCRLPVRGPRLLVCANKACPKRLYHSDCIEPIALVHVDNRKWICNACAPSVM
ncbi:Zinc finger domain-containing protein, PHD-finger [Cordyceps militaris CM01]|uniref:Zinc finger domain-containing protein, PHD-finger n=1 Tax=Cordyceps militaris (strain CM01) TaxID=983644 RepID=G3JNB4_CORMM|nr:Zinc finger domain-containing protein, PHD-finger [Cordyceps militaris CM01]EGX90296.1 Zinc finger domain-containing protein, PHD-finger [Cordyceps militaris CM01]